MKNIKRVIIVFLIIMIISMLYNVFAKVSNPKDLIIAKEIINNGEEYYEIVDGSEYEKALSLFHKEEL